MNRKQEIGWIGLLGLLFLLGIDAHSIAGAGSASSAAAGASRRHDLPILVASRLPKPLGNPPPNGIKFFATADVLELGKDRSWLAKMTNNINQHWRKKNERQNGKSPNDAHNGRSHALAESSD